MQDYKLIGGAFLVGFYMAFVIASLIYVHSEPFRNRKKHSGYRQYDELSEKDGSFEKERDLA